MLEYQRLFDEDRDSRRAVADAVAVLHRYAGFNQSDRAKIRVRPMLLASRDVIGLVDVLFAAEDMAVSVSLPTAARFKGKKKGTAQQLAMDIIHLNRAEVDQAGTVALADGCVYRKFDST